MAAVLSSGGHCPAAAQVNHAVYQHRRSSIVADGGIMPPPERQLQRSELKNGRRMSGDQLITVKKFLDKLPLLQFMTEKTRSELVHRKLAVPAVYQDGEPIVVAGDMPVGNHGDGVFIMLSGAAVAEKHFSGEKAPRVVWEYRMGKDPFGDFFGEGVMQRGAAVPRAATVRAVGSVEVLRFDRPVWRSAVSAARCRNAASHCSSTEALMYLRRLKLAAGAHTHR